MGGGYDINYYYAYVDRERSWDYWNKKKGLRTIYNVTVYPNIRMYYNGDYMHRYKGARNMAKFKRYLDKVVPIITDHIASPSYNPDKNKLNVVFSLFNLFHLLHDNREI